MKKLIFSILILILCLTSFMLISCGGEDDTTTSSTVRGPNTPVWSSKSDIRDTWSGKTLNIACSTWARTPSAPWSVAELCVEKGKESGFGTVIDTAVLEREDYIKNTYGVTLNFINATQYYMQDALEAAALSNNINYDLCIPRMMNVQPIATGGYVYDLANRELVDLRNSYYNENSVNAFTAYGHTFFVTGGYSTLDIESAFVLLFNKKLLGDGSEKATDDLYALVKDGKWTYDKLVSYANAAYKDDGDGIRDGDDVFGLDINVGLGNFYDYFGVTHAGVNKATNQWEITFNKDREKIDDIINVIIEAEEANWRCPAFGGGWGSIHEMFRESKTLFINQTFYSTWLSDYVDIGIVPFPMLNEDQGRYYVPCSQQTAVVMCIPKITQERAMSEYFLDVLSWTGEEYTRKAYLETKKAHFKTDADMEMVTDYIIPNIFYDAGRAVGWDELLNNINTSSWANNKNNFDKAYAKKEPDALKTIAEWNNAWGSYTEN